MGLLTEIQPYIRAAHKYNYKGSREEQRRRGYTYAFHLFTDGHGHMVVNDERYSVSCGTLIFVRPGEPHSFEHIPGEAMDACNIYCDLWSAPGPDQPTFAYEWNSYDEGWLTERQPCEELDKIPTCISLRAYPHLIELLNQTLIAYNRQGKYASEAASSCFYAWMLQWSDCMLEDHLADYRIARILEEMDRYPEQRKSYEYWCEQSGLEKSQFYRLFKLETGMSPKAYILDARMKKAAVLLMESSRSVTEIALSLGYDSVHYFTNQFTSIYGVSPTSYRSGLRSADTFRWS
ncbi:AraC family transcriptional regulator [Paenibacillus marinisediminis]